MTVLDAGAREEFVYEVKVECGQLGTYVEMFAGRVPVVGEWIRFRTGLDVVIGEWVVVWRVLWEDGHARLLCRPAFADGVVAS